MAESITIPIGTSLRDAERRIIEATLRSMSGNIAGAARILQIDRGTLYGKLKKHQIGFCNER